MERLNNELYSTKQQLENKLKDEEKRNEETNKKVKQLQSEKKTEIIKQLQQLKQTTAKLKDWLEKNSHEMIKSEMELDKYIQKVLQKFPTLESKWWQNTDISQKLPDVKQAAEHLKAELEFRSREINSEKEKDEIIQKLMKTFPTLDSKWKKNTDIIKQLVQVKQRAEGLKKQLQAKTHESEEKTETIHQLQQLKQAAETLKIQLESKNQQMIKSEREKNEIIQKLMETFPTLGSKWKENTDIIYQLQEVKETAEKLKQLEKKHLELQGETDSDIIKQLQQVKDKAENLKHQMESINWQMLQAEKTRNEETDRKLKELVKQLEEKKNKTEETLNELQLSGNISQAQEEKQKMEREIKRLRNELESTKQQLQQEKQAAENLKKQLEDKNHESSKPQKSDFILDEVHKYGPYICLRNTSSEVKLMTGWELKQQINDRNPVTYKFQENFTLKAGEGLTLHRFSTTRGPYPDNTHLMWKDMNNWYSGDNVKISLISSTGEEHRLQ